MPKSRIISDLVNGTTTLIQALDRLHIIATEVGDRKTVKWVEHEKKGYSEPNVPSYRIVQADKQNSYPIPFGIIHLNFSYLKYQQGSTSTCPLFSECSISNDNNTLNDVACKNCTNIDELFESIKTEFINRAIKLEKKFGVLDNFDVNLTDDKENYDETLLNKAIEMMNNHEKNTVNINITNNGGKISNFANNTKKEKTTTNDINVQTNVAINKKENWFTKFLKLFKRKKK